MNWHTEYFFNSRPCYITCGRAIYSRNRTGPLMVAIYYTDGNRPPTDGGISYGEFMRFARPTGRQVKRCALVGWIVKEMV